MRRPLVAALSALLLLTANYPAQAAAAPEPQDAVVAAPDAGDQDTPFPWGAGEAELLAEEDPIWSPGQELVPTQRHGFTQDPAAVEDVAEPVVATGQSTLPAPQPGAEVYNRPADGVYDLIGGGFGHRIGMSQYGADGAGKAGRSYRQILDFYYPGTALQTRSLGTIRIGITIDNDGVTRVEHREGLQVSAGPTGTTYDLPATSTQWRVRATGSTASTCVLEGLSGTTWTAYWPAGMPRSCPVSFSSPTESTVDLFLPDGSRRIYRGVLTATHTGVTRLTTVNALPMQHYLRSVVSAEMPNWFHAEALKTQAVAARTYAARGAGGNAHYDTCDTTWCQAYRGRGARTSTGGITTYEYTPSTAAVDATPGQVLTFAFPGGVALATTMYSSSNGGYAAPAGNGHTYMPAHADPYDSVAGNARHSWTAEIPVSALESRYAIERVERVQVLTRDGHGQWGGRVLTARIEGFTATGAYTYADATGTGLRLTRPWPGTTKGLSSDYFTFVADGATSAQPVRLAGTNRFGTGEQVARQWPGGVSVAYVVSGRNHPDALAAAARAGVYGAPVVLVEQGSIPEETARALSHLRPGRLVVVGGPAAVSSPVLQELDQYTAGSVQRVSGSDRYGTASALAGYYPAQGARVYLTSGQNFPDALAGAALAGHQQAPMLLTRSDRLDETTIKQLDRLDAGEVVVLGGADVVSDTVARQAAAYTTSGTFRRLSGTSRYDTAAVIAEQFPAGASPAYVASGQDFPDALVGAALAGRQGVPLVLTPADRVHEGTARALQHQQPGAMYVLGGTSVVFPATVEALAAYLR